MACSSSATHSAISGIFAYYWILNIAYAFWRIRIAWAFFSGVRPCLLVTNRGNGTNSKRLPHLSSGVDQQHPLTAEEELNRLLERASRWKQLRDKLKETKIYHYSEMAALCVQPEKEFRERTALKDEELDDLNGQPAQFHRERSERAEQHEMELDRAIYREREACTLWKDVRNNTHAVAFESEMQRLRGKVELKEKEVTQSGHGVVVVRDQLDRLAFEHSQHSALVSNGVVQIEGNNGACGCDQVFWERT
ncbi:hypothetical protein TRVL_05772 [Trypanosoma vivax]|nr:hypothetical protein TRVL_05772 [Trypanosoma vivax]